MRYFIDFEAAQPSNEIISIGCVDENNNTFYSEVRAKAKITPFITSLTKITNKQNKEAETSDEVFTNFFHWINAHKDEKATFYCYGNSDILFIKQNLKKTNNLHAQMALSVIGMNLEDFSIHVMKHFGLVQEISLIKVLSYYRNAQVKQAHNALEDAMFLKEIFEKMKRETKVIGTPFPNYMQHPPKHESISYREKILSSNVQVLVYRINNNNKILEKKCQSLQSARNYVVHSLIKTSPSTKSHPIYKNIENRILKSDKNKIPYFNRLWELHPNSTEEYICLPLNTMS